jgi:hypothetical protein
MPKAYKTEAEFNAESWAVKEDWKLDRSDYRKIVRQINQDLSKSYSVLWGQCNLALQNIVKQDDDFIAMNPGDVQVLYKASSEWIPARYSKYITGMDRRYCPHTDCLKLDAAL